MKTQKKFSSGFTLIELMVTIAIIAMVGGTIAGILSAMTRGVSKSNANAIVRQNGETALTQASRVIRNAQRFLGVSSGAGDIYVTDCSSAPTAPTPPPGGYKYVKVLNFSDTKDILQCIDEPGDIYLNGTSLINKNEVEMEINSCSFACSQKSLGGPVTMTIEYKLNLKGQPGETGSPLLFRTSVSSRNPL